MRSQDNNPYGISSKDAEKLWSERSYAEQILAEENIPIDAISAQPDLASKPEQLRNIRAEYLKIVDKEPYLSPLDNLHSKDPKVFFDNFFLIVEEWKAKLLIEDYVRIQINFLVPLITDFLRNWNGEGNVGLGLNKILEHEDICTARELQYQVYDIIKAADLSLNQELDQNSRRRLEVAKAFYLRDNNIDHYCSTNYRIDAILPAFIRSQAEKEIPALNTMIAVAETEEYRNIKFLQEIAIGNPKGSGGWSSIKHFLTFGTSTSLIGLMNIFPPHIQPILGLIAFGVDAYSIKQMFPSKSKETEEAKEKTEEKLHSFPVRYGAAFALASLLENMEIASGKRWIIEKTLLHMLKDESLDLTNRLQVAHLIKKPLTNSGLGTLLYLFQNSDEKTQVVCGFALTYQNKEKIKSAVDRMTLANLPHMREALAAIREAQRNRL